MKTIKISKQKTSRYDNFTDIIRDDASVFSAPPTKDIKEIIKNFRATKLYSPSFLNSLIKGMHRSSYFSVDKRTLLKLST